MTTLVRLCAVALAGLLMTSEAFSWGNATHTFFTKQLGQRIGAGNNHEMYGAVMVDAFNIVYTNNGQILRAVLHASPDAMMAQAFGCDLRATAFGLNKPGARRRPARHGRATIAAQFSTSSCP